MEFFNGSEYRKAKSRNKKTDPSDFIEKYEIKFARIPGCENMTQQEYGRFIMQSFNKRRQELIGAFEKHGYKWPSKEAIKRTKPTDCARNPKRTERGGFHPLIICKRSERRQQFMKWYFSIVVQYKAASKKYLAGDSSTVFPPGTIKPPGPYVQGR